MRKISLILLCLAASCQLLLAGDRNCCCWFARFLLTELFLQRQAWPVCCLPICVVTICFQFRQALRGGMFLCRLSRRLTAMKEAFSPILLRLPGEGSHRVLLKFKSGSADLAKPVAGPVRTKWLAVTHDPARFGGLPSRIEFLETGRVVSGSNFSWNDRLYHRQNGGFTFRDTQAPSVTLVLKDQSAASFA